MTALLLLACVPVLIWAAQTVQLCRCGLPVRWRIDHRGAPPTVRLTVRIATQVGLLGLLAAYPLIVGSSPLTYYAATLPGGDSVWHGVQGAAAAVLCLTMLYAGWLAAGRIDAGVHQSRRRWRRRLTLLVPTAVFGATVEELLFRGVVLADLLRATWCPTSVAIMVGALVFAAAHYVRAVKRRWTFPGHLALGVLLCVAFVRSGALWLPIGLHAGGILFIMGCRPFLRLRGPDWLTGASIFPFAGVVGILGLAVLTGYVARAF